MGQVSLQCDADYDSKLTSASNAVVDDSESWPIDLCDWAWVDDLHPVYLYNPSNGTSTQLLKGSEQAKRLDLIDHDDIGTDYL